MQDYEGQDLSNAADRIVFERLVRSGKDALQKPNFVNAIQAFSAAAVKARSNRDVAQKEQSCQWLAGTLLEFKRVSESSTSTNQAIQIMESFANLTNVELIEILLDVCTVYETQNKTTDADYLLKQLLSRAMRCPAPKAQEFTALIQRRIFESRSKQPGSVPAAHITWIG